MDVTVGFLLENLKTLISNHISSIQGASSELKLLETELVKFNAILVVASTKYKKDETFRAWENEIRETVYDIEDVIDTCYTHIAADKNKKLVWFRRLFSGTKRTLAEEVKDLREKKVIPMLQSLNFANFSIADKDDSTAEAAKHMRTQKSQHIVGFKKETESFIKVLNQDSDKMKILSIIGMAGLGKTTLAYKIFEDDRIDHEFPVRIWVNISDTINMRNVLLTILEKFTDTLLYASDPENQLIQIVKNKLEEAKFFMVMDDVWTTEAWEKIRPLLPENNNLGRILITTRDKFVASFASTETAHNLRFLDPDESWELLQYKVYNNLNVVPNELVAVGRAIAHGCDGLPLSIVIIGGILMERRSKLGDNVDRIKSEWSDISSSVKSHLTGGKLKILEHIISLSYQKLAYELRNCFLYLGVFPEDADIPVKKLIRLWIAEGFIKERVGGKSLEKIAHEKLEELINLNLLMVREAKPNGEAKICHMHDSIRETCISEASYEKQNLFQEIYISEGGFKPHENIENFRRLCIHSYVLPFFAKWKQFPKARSFMCFSKSPIKLEAKQMAFTDGFGLLRVYEAKNIIFPKFPQKIKQLLHLRYLTLALDKGDDLPEMISDLWNLQTLTVDVTSIRELKMKADIWKMRQLRHFQTKASITFISGGKSGEGGENLQTIGRMSPASCTIEFFSKAKNLTTLGIQGNLNQLVMSSDGLGKLNRLNKLKLVHDHSAVAAEHPLCSLPQYQCFPAKLKMLVLIATNLDWTLMSVLSMFPSLEVLKLKDNAFKGNSWEVGGGFHHLIHLHIEKATELVTWTSLVSDPFPALKYLYIIKCEKLIQFPLVLGKKLELLYIQRAKFAISSANNIVAEQEKQGRTVKLQIAATDKSSNHDS